MKSLTSWIQPVRGVLITLMVSIVGCGLVPVLSGDIFDGLEDVLAEAEPISTFDGEWLNTGYGYAFEITNRTGLVTIGNSSLLDVGDVILVIATVDGASFTGRHIFTDGTIREVDGRLLDADSLFMTDGEIIWTMSRFNANLTPAAAAQFVATPFQTPVTITLIGRDLDGGPQAISFGILTWPENGQLTGQPPAVTYTPDVGFVGTDTFSFSVSDGASQSSAATVTISVAMDNGPPSVDAGSNASITLPTNSVDLDGTVSDDGRPSGVLTTTWSTIDGPTSAYFANANAVDTVVIFSQVGTYVLQLEASDGVITVTDTVTVFVHAE